MIILSANNLGKIYGTDVIIRNASFSVNAGDRIGIVGKNGAGKTTLLNMLTGELPHDEGEFFVSESTRIGYLKQRDNFFMKSTVYEEIDSIFEDIHRIERGIQEITGEIDRRGASGQNVDDLVQRLDALHLELDIKGGYTYKSEMIGVLNSMGFTPEWYDKKIETLSGGERTRLALAALLLKKPDILMMDEPTNHLDIQTLKWLEQYLLGYKGTLLIVSHDRYFLDQVVNRVFEVTLHKVNVYEGNYTEYARQRSVRFESEMRAYENQQKEIRRQEDMIRIMKEHNTEHLVKRAQSREKRLDMLERLERPEMEHGKMKIHFKQNFKSGNDVIFAENLSKGFYDKRTGKVGTLFSNVDLDIKRGERICIVGPNGVGKTTLLRTLLGELEPKEGRVKIGHNVAFGYYDQGQLLLNGENTVLEELKESYRLYTDTEMRNILGRFLFRNDDVFLKVKSLSGGEKARLSLVKLMLSGSNTLVLDEPTNHLDIDSKEAFEDALMDFPGTAIIVSHDRYFLSKIPTRILELTSDGVVEYLGKYDYYLEKKQQEKRIQEEQEEALRTAGSKTVGVSGLENAASSNCDKSAGTSGLSPQELRQLKKQYEADVRRLERKTDRLEVEISNLEAEADDKQKQMTATENMTDYELLAKLGEEINGLREQLEEKEMDYLETCEELEQARENLKGCN